jgi:electron transfer flavoprotein alpha subunit
MLIAYESPTIRDRSADIIVSLGRGIKEADDIALVQQLADALGGELPTSRPELYLLASGTTRAVSGARQVSRP